MTAIHPRAEQNGQIPQSSKPLKVSKKALESRVTNEKMIPKGHLAPSSAGLKALDLGVKKGQALNVPALALPGSSPRTWESLQVEADQLTENQLADKNGNFYDLGEPFSHGSYGLVRYAVKKDGVVDQRYVVKEVAMTKASAKEFLFTEAEQLAYEAETKKFLPKTKEVAQKHKNLSRRLKLATTKEEMLRAEVEAMLIAKTPIAPHAILRTDKSAFVLLPVAAGDICTLFEAIDKKLNPRAAQDPSTKHALEQQQLQVGKKITESLFLSGGRYLTNLHEKGVAHQDVKAENFLFDLSGEVFLSDYGLASPNIKGGTIKGTPFNLPFEAFIWPDLHDYPYIPAAADVWSLGSTAMEMLTGKHVTSEMIENHWKDRKTFETQMLFSACFEDYQNVWTKINEAVKSGLGQDTAIRVDDSPNSNEPYFVNLLMDMHDASPNLFGLLLKTLHPNPLERIGAPELFSQLKSYFGTDSINLKDTLWTLGVDANSLPIKESKPEAATQNQVSALAYLRRAPVGLYAPVPSRQSFVEPGAAHPPAQKPFFRLGPSPAQDPVKTEKDPA